MLMISALLAFLGTPSITGGFPEQRVSGAGLTNLWMESRADKAYIHLADGHLTARSCDVSKPSDSELDFSSRFKIWQTPWQQRCRDACQVLERYDHYNARSSCLG